jgi:hypothetical protein
MKMLRHDDIPQDYEPIVPSNAFKYLKEQITASFAVEQGLALIATECEEVKIVSAKKSVQAFGHA